MSNNILITLLPKIILYNLIRHRQKVQKTRVRRRPLWPIYQQRARAQRIRIERIKERNVVGHDGTRGFRERRGLVDFEDVAAVEGAEKGRAVEVGGCLPGA